MPDVTCPSCGAANPAGSQFCEACGADLPGGAPAPAAGADPATAGAETSATATDPALPRPAPLPDDAPQAAPRPSAGPGTMVPAEEPGHEPGHGPGPSGAAPVSAGNVDPATLPAPAPTATPIPPVAGEESPLDVGWTGVVAGQASPYEQQPAQPACASCGTGHYLDGYCDQCGAKEPNPRDRLEESPTQWVGGISDIGKRHTRNEDGMALSADADPGSRAVLVVCDGVSNTTDSDVASLAAARAARAVLDAPLGAGAGTPEAARAAAIKRLGEAAAAANQAVIATVTNTADPAPPSCTFVAAVITGGSAVVGNIGDSRAYWLPDDGEGTRQLTQDDSFAADRIAAGVDRKEAETGPGAHSITRWLGSDAPEDLTPHTAQLALERPGWFLVCSDGLWNYCSEAAALHDQIATFAAAGMAGSPAALATALVDFANNAGGADNITVALARIDPVTPEGGSHG